MSYLWGILGWAVVLATLWDAFTTIVVPKTVERGASFSGAYYNFTWALWHRIAGALKDGPLRMSVLTSFAPISMLLLFLLWAASLALGFALIQFSHGSLGDGSPFTQYLYFSGETFFTLGYGDMTPKHGIGQFISVLEAGTGFAFLALVIGYIPVLYGHFSTREQLIVQLDSRAGSDPSVGQLLAKYGHSGAMEDLVALLKDWEIWSAKQLEAYLSYPVLAFYRSQHDDQSWLCSLTCILDTCAVIEMGFGDDHPWAKRLQFQAQATFAMGRHVIVDLAYLLNAGPDFKAPSRLPDSTYDQLCKMLNDAGIGIQQGRIEAFRQRRAMYEPYCISLAKDLLFTLPGWVPQPGAVENWQLTAWDRANHF
ncbi:MAG: two pore domain potassium channel family protein [Chlorobia bacterium]|nr:two pore domain potassium channel family protein [Fimbriimonadaceae bacterium]